MFSYRAPAAAGAFLLALLLPGCAPTDEASPAVTPSGTTSASAAACAPDSLDTKTAGTLTIGTDKPAYEPWFVDDDPSNGKGFESAVAYAVADKLGYEQAAVKWVTASFNSVIQPGAKPYDMDINQFSITPERQKAVDFSTPYVCSGAAIVAKDGGARTVADLAGKVVGVQVGTTYLTAVDKVPGVKEVKTFPKDTDALQNLLAGRTDVWVSDKLTALTASEKAPEAKLQIGDLLYEERYGMAFKKGNDDLRGAVDKVLAAMLSGESYKAISDHYFKQDIRCP
jgi:polar amino acid transport system substrate-binding protein